jgi:hypothetical protein
MRVTVALHARGAGTATIGGQPYRTPKKPSGLPAHAVQTWLDLGGAHTAADRYAVVKLQVGRGDAPDQALCG